jgi:selenocysteine-specific translation elongation factor
MIRTVDNWIVVIANADATHEGDAQAAARRILNDLTGYPHSHNRSYINNIEDDVKQLANAMQAYARLLQQSGVTA